MTSGHPPPLAAQRRALILARLGDRGCATVAELSALLGVTTQTVRRDLRALSSDGRVDVVHGGALARERPRASARLAGLVRPGTSVGLCAGSGAVAAARELGRIAGLTVVTTSLAAAAVLGRAPARPVTVLVPGALEGDEIDGPMAASAIAGLGLDLALITGPSALAAARGWPVQRAFTAAARRTHLVTAPGEWWPEAVQRTSDGSSAA